MPERFRGVSHDKVQIQIYVYFTLLISKGSSLQQVLTQVTQKMVIKIDVIYMYKFFTLKPTATFTQPFWQSEQHHETRLTIIILIVFKKCMPLVL